MLLIPASPRHKNTVPGLTPHLENNMEFTENQQHPLHRMSRLGVVALLHVALLAVLLSSMKITITPKLQDPVMVDFEKPETKKQEPEPKFERELPKPKDPPPYIPESEVNTKTPPLENTIKEVTTDRREGTVKRESGGTEGGTGIVDVAPKTPVHVAAVINLNACDKPAYPASSIRTGETGTVTLSMLIGTDGKVIETKTLESSGYRALDRAASQALSQCRFTPGTIDGVTQQSWTKVQYVWKID